MLTTHRTLHCFGWKNASLTECFLNLTDVGGKHCFLLVLRRRDSLMLAQFQPQHKCIDVENPNSFLSSSLSTNNTYLTPSSFLSFLCVVCTYVYMHVSCGCRHFRLIPENPPLSLFLPLYTKAVSVKHKAH